jgi:DNA ligase (NAD+)
MEKQEIKNRIDWLIDEINKCDYAYYIDAKSLISDFEYDKLFAELVELENNFPNFINPNSPTQRISGNPISNFETIQHKISMLSLANTYNENDLKNFDNRINKLLDGERYEYFAELKFDGVSMSLRYTNGEYKQAITRGNGIQGDDVSNNIRTIKILPMKVNDVFVDGTKLTDFEVRGEVYIGETDFVKLNENRLEQGYKEFANARNLTAGTIKLLDHKEVAKRPLRMICYYLFTEQVKLKSQSSNIELLRQLGFPVSPVSKKCNDIDSVWKYITDWKNKRHTLGFQTDGIVIKVNSMKQQDFLGAVSRHPRWAIAYKYEPEQAETILHNITLQVGRTGIVTPVAELEPVFIAGSTISRATLHNADFIAELGLCIGDSVIIEKGGDVIPKVSKVVLEKRNADSILYTFPTHCSCDLHSPIERLDGVHYYCTNSQCPHQIRRRIEYFVSSERMGGMDISGFGEKIVERLCSLDYLKNVADIYTLKEHTNELVSIEGMGIKGVSKLLNAIEESKKLPFSRVLNALGIRYVGEKNAKILARYFGSIENMRNATIEEISSINEIGETIAKSVYNTLHNNSFIEIVNKLKEYGLQFEEKNIEPTNNKLSGKTFVFTGELPTMTRTEAAKLVERFGGKESKSISKKTSFVVVGDAPGNKYNKALEFGVTILSEEELKKMVSE